MLREVIQARDDALDAMDHTQWKLDKMKREMQQLLREAAAFLFYSTAASPNSKSMKSEL